MTFIEQSPRDGKPRVPSKKRDRLPQGLRFDVFRRDNFTCVYCGGQSPQVTLVCDHKTPVAKGGKDTFDNLVTSCFDCNRGKGSKTVDYAPSNSATPGHAKSSDPLVGLWGHSIDEDGFIHWQFYIKGAVGDGYAVQLFSWWDGRPTDVKIIKTVDLTGDKHRLYSSEEEWLHAADVSAKKQREAYAASDHFGGAFE